jgi:hypothetical protein
VYHSVHTQTLEELEVREWLTRRKLTGRVTSDQQRAGVEIAKACHVIGIPVREGLKRGWEESSWRWKAVGHNRDLSNDHGAMQVNDRWTPGILKQTPREQIYTGVAILKRYYFRCRYDWSCAHYAYRTGRVK